MKVYLLSGGTGEPDGSGDASWLFETKELGIEAVKNSFVGCEVEITPDLQDCTGFAVKRGDVEYRYYMYPTVVQQLPRLSNVS